MKCDSCIYKSFTTLGDMYGAMSGGDSFYICDKTGEPLQLIVDVWNFDVNNCRYYDDGKGEE